MSSDELSDVLAEIDEELAEAILEAIEDSPEEVREALEERGLIDRYVEHEDVDSESNLSESEELLLEFMESIPNPKSTDELLEIVETEEPEVYQRFSSAKHRSWLNNKLNLLVRDGQIGKYRDGRSVYYTPNPGDAVRRWALHNDKFPEEVSRGDADDIVADTGMNRSTVLRVIRELQESE